MTTGILTNIFQFRAQSKNMRSHLLDWMREVASEVLGLPAAYFKADYDRSKTPELQALLKFDVNTAKVSKFAPVLFPKEHRKTCKNDKAFLSPALPLVAISLVN
jgi:hypothetical protein